MDDLGGLMPVNCLEALQWVIKKRDRTEWGCWRYHPHNLTLECADKSYAIDLGRCCTSSEVLDAIFQIRGKTWATPIIKSDLLDAINDLLNPQGALCSFGDNIRIDPREILPARAIGEGRL